MRRAENKLAYSALYTPNWIWVLWKLINERDCIHYCLACRNLSVVTLLWEGARSIFCGPSCCRRRFWESGICQSSGPLDNKASMVRSAVWDIFVDDEWWLIYKCILYLVLATMVPNPAIENYKSIIFSKELKPPQNKCHLSTWLVFIFYLNRSRTH